MKFASACQTFIERFERNVTRVVNEAIAADKSKIYINTLSEIKSFIENFKDLLQTLKLLEDLLPEQKAGRICFKWVYAEDANTLSLARLESGFSMIYTGEYLRITYDDKSITLYSTPRVGININKYQDEIDLTDEEGVEVKRSLVFNVISTLRDQISRSIENLNLCVKYIKLRSG